MARALGRLSLNRGGPRDLRRDRDTVCSAAQNGGSGPVWQRRRFRMLLRSACARGLHSRSPSSRRLAAALGRPAAASAGRWRSDTAGFDGELDAHRALRDDSRQVIVTMQLDFAQRFGVASLKIRHHAQLGYIIEAPAIAVEKLRDFPELTLRQGMANGARFTTPELSELDQRITEAGERAAARETHGVRAPGEDRDLAHAEALAACAEALALSGCSAIGCETGGSRHLVPPRLTDGDEFCSKPDATRWSKRRSSVTRHSCRTAAISRPISVSCC